MGRRQMKDDIAELEHAIIEGEKAAAGMGADSGADRQAVRGPAQAAPQIRGSLRAGVASLFCKSQCPEELGSTLTRA